jgi:hypothetical protein
LEEITSELSLEKRENQPNEQRDSVSTRQDKPTGPKPGHGREPSRALGPCLKKTNSGLTVWRMDLRRTRQEAGGPISKLLQHSWKELTRA